MRSTNPLLLTPSGLKTKTTEVCIKDYSVCIAHVVQSEKAKLLMDHEVEKLQELDNQYESELKDWKHNLRFRKQVLCVQLPVAIWKLLKSVVHNVHGHMFPFTNHLP